ncbi:MAG: hypothetical protein JNJ58_07335 [Chitinophagaceae bacterium]|nr:hypothetical protein [Chitinophagaceae bacterium]
MKTTFLSALLCLSMLLSVSVKAQSLSPIQFSDHLTAIVDSLYASGKQWGTSFNEAYKTKDYASLTPYRANMEKYILACIVELKAMKDVKNSRDLRMAVLDLLYIEQKLVVHGLKPLEAFNSQSSAEEVKAAMDKISKDVEVESREIQKVSAAQIAYAKANGFRIEGQE